MWVCRLGTFVLLVCQDHEHVPLDYILQLQSTLTHTDTGILSLSKPISCLVQPLLETPSGRVSTELPELGDDLGGATALTPSWHHAPRVSNPFE